MTQPDATTTIHEGPQFDVVRETWGDREREIVRHAGSTAVVAVHDGAVVLVRQTREAARRPLLELPAGTLEDGEDPRESAQRELEEEVGLRGGRWTELGVYYTSPGFLDERMHLFLAEDLERGEQDLEEGEDVDIVRWPVDELEARLGEVEDMKTLAGLLAFLRRR